MAEGILRPTILESFDVYSAPRQYFNRHEVRALLPGCSWQDCSRVGTKWIARAVCNCDEHGSSYLPDTPWAAFARQEGM